MRFFLQALAAGVVASLLMMTPLTLAHSGSPSPTTWSPGTGLTAQALNDTIAHVHNTFSGGIVDAHLSSSAAIAHSKMATPSLIPKMQTRFDCTSGSSCTINWQSGLLISSVSYGTTGDYTVNLNAALTDTTFTVSLSGEGTAGAANMRVCSIVAKTTTTIRIQCSDTATPTLRDAIVHLVLWDA